MKYKINYGKIYLLKVITIMMFFMYSFCIQIQLDQVHEKQFNQLFAHRSGRHILGFVQKGVVDYGNVNDVINRAQQQIEEQKIEYESQINYSNKMISRIQNDQEKYLNMILQKKQFKELELSQLNQKFYQNYKQPKDYQQQQFQIGKSNLDWLEDKIKQTQKIISDSEQQYKKDIEQVQTSFSSVIDIFSLIDEMKHLQRLNQAGIGQKKQLLSSKVEELCKSKISNSLIFLKTEINVLLSQNLEDPKTIEKVRNDLKVLIEEILDKRDEAQSSYEKTLADQNQELNYLQEKKKEATLMLKKANITLSNLEKNVVQIEQEINEIEQFLSEVENQIQQKNQETTNLVQMHQQKIKEIQNDQQKIQSIEQALYDDAFSTFLVKKLENQNFRILEDNIW
ncbi:transmembrane protein, putative (macronuclear) [Tetrahymena thermophila SB210]|uniref:Transmembrane protein, putative n=1 Tax=Tetrahymena thermophila (strain SB210) TaxID=312017 RepID=I7MMD0_TETTS|nr:transmembrane protein, putative [Tetrahymena thermophila SB210]EAS04614.2 transmembrane protein, putative [Tetrahymena thermophila SB210]|eukprot:XP_001024859.2 transmembrane protein, putative [Tetrahymena thermophila SB210]